MLRAKRARSEQPSAEIHVNSYNTSDFCPVFHRGLQRDCSFRSCVERTIPNLADHRTIIDAPGVLLLFRYNCFVSTQGRESRHNFALLTTYNLEKGEPLSELAQ